MSQPILDMVLFATNRCNLRCVYCYEPAGGQLSLTPEVGEQAVRWFLAQGAGARRDLMVAFYGGEPLVNYPLLHHLVRYGKREAGAAGRRLRFGITTNGTLLTEERLEFFAREDVSLIVSIDGTPEAHDRFRRTAAGRGSFEILDRVLPALVERRPRTFARMTVNPETVGDLAAGARFLLARGLRYLAIAPNVETAWSRDDWAELDRQCREVTELQIDRLLSGERVWINFVDEGIRILRRNRRPGAPCGAGKTLVGVSVSGEIFPCHRFVSSFGFAGAHRLGDVWSGIDEDARRPFARYTSEHCLGCATPCEVCPARELCGGGCIAKAAEHNRNFLLPLRQEQYVYCIWAEIARDVWEVLADRDLPLLGSFARRAPAAEPDGPPVCTWE